MRKLVLGLSLLFVLPLGCSGREKPTDPAANREIPSWFVPPKEEGLTYVRFLAFGDWGTGHDDQRKCAEAMAKKIRGDKEPVDFFLTTGDNFYGDGVESIDDSQWDYKFEEVYAGPEFERPFWASLGNHDHKGNVQAQLDYGKQKSKRWKMPAQYYAFSKDLGEGTSVEFFVLDTTPLGGRTRHQAQMAWFEKKLEASKATWKIVVGHHPMYSHSKRPFSYPLIKRLEPLFEKYGVDLYLAGHDHVLEHVKPKKGVHHVTTGAAAGPSKAYKVEWTDDSFYAATLGGFVVIRVSRKDLVIEYVRMNGKTQYAHVLQKGRTEPF